MGSFGMGLAVALALAIVFSQPAVASNCEFVIQWDERAIGRCVKELKDEIRLLQLGLQTLETENRLLTGHICLLAQELKSMGRDTSSIADDACAELRARAAKRRPKKP